MTNDAALVPSEAQTDAPVQQSTSVNDQSCDQRDDKLNIGDQDQGIVVNASEMTGDLLPAPKKKKKKSKPASKRGIGKPTGFEEFHADAPLTLEQVAESRVAFNQDVPFVDRILKAIQRFERTRKLSPERRDVFYKYLAYGGVDVGPNMFMGAVDTEDMDKDQINTAMAQASISEEMKNTIVDPKQQKDSTTSEGSKLRSSEHLAKYTVDFEGTMCSFLSRQATELYVFETMDNVDIVTTTLERFMDYLLLHDVCPEYSSEVLSTRNLCRVARTELWNCAETQRNLPGMFNIACSTLFGGCYDGNYGQEKPQDDTFIGLDPEKATQIVGFAIAGAASEEVYSRYLDITTGDSAGEGFEIINVVRDHGFEITKVEKPTRDCINLYKENTSEFRPVGKVYAKFFRSPDASPEDLTQAEAAALASNETNKSEKVASSKYTHDYIFFVESDPLHALLCPRMRVKATIYELNCGIWFFDEVIRVLPSFDLWLENELMLGWKEPKPLTGAPGYIWNGGDKEKAAIEVEEFTAIEPSQNGATDNLQTSTANTGQAIDEIGHEVATEDDTLTNGQRNNIHDSENPY